MTKVGSLFYLATPYTNYPDGIEIAFREASRLCAELLKSGIEAYSPIAHCHPLAMHGDLDALDRDFWLKYQRSMMLRCDGLIVAEMIAWNESHGIRHEIEFFTKSRKPIFHLKPLDMTIRQIHQPIPAEAGDA